MMCLRNEIWDQAQRILVLSDGRMILLPSETWFRSKGMTESDYLAAMSGVSAYVIEATSASGQPEVLYDHTEAGQAEVDANNDNVRGMLDAAVAGCGGCATGGSLPGGALALLGLALATRRRRS